MFCKLWAFALNLFWHNKEVLKSFFCRKKLASNFFVLCLFSVFVSCQVEEDLEDKKASGEQFKTEIQDYLNSIVIKKIEGSLFTAKDLIATINYQSTRAVVLNDVQTLLIADLGNVTDNDKAIATKLVLYLHKDGIQKAKIITFENYFSDYNSTIKYMLNNENEELAYSGKVLIHSIEGRFEFSGELDQGRLKAHSRAFPNTKDIIAKTTRYCTSWYRIDRIGEEIISVTFLFKTCEAENDSYGGVSGDSEGTGEWAIFPVQPQDKDKFTHFAPDGIMTVYQYNAARNSWNIIAIPLPELAIPNHAAHNQHLQHVQFPQHQQIVIGTQFTYQYNSFSGSWLAEPKIETDLTCLGLKKLVTSISTDAEFTTAVSSIKAAANADGFEHSITLGKDSNGKITQAPMNNGTSQYLVKTNTTWVGAFAAIHNHPNGTPMSAGDIYAAVSLNTLRPNFTTTFLVLPDGSMYALVVTDLEAAKAFVTDYPADQLPGYSPEFPNFIFDQIEAIQTSDMTYTSIEGKTKAISIILDKYNSGITLLKQDSNGNFNPIKMEETVQNGNTIYTPKPCN